MKLNLGCGSQVLDGWTNVDYALGARFAKLPLFRAANRKLSLFAFKWDPRIYLHNLTKPLPWPDQSADVVYSSHTLEHLSREDGLRLLKECRRVLKRNGIIRIVVPDLRHHVAEYMQGRIKAEDFVESLGVLYGNSENAVKNRLAPFIQFPHRCMYDTQGLLSILETLGFSATSRQAFDSSIQDIHQLEIASRTVAAVVVEGFRR
jgi:ubiquinone/menaquinone biosynthesis C-methylase UbiE